MPRADKILLCLFSLSMLSCGGGSGSDTKGSANFGVDDTRELASAQLFTRTADCFNVEAPATIPAAQFTSAFTRFEPFLREQPCSTATQYAQPRLEQGGKAEYTFSLNRAADVYVYVLLRYGSSAKVGQVDISLNGQNRQSLSFPENNREALSYARRSESYSLGAGDHTLSLALEAFEPGLSEDTVIVEEIVLSADPNFGPSINGFSVVDVASAAALPGLEFINSGETVELNLDVLGDAPLTLSTLPMDGSSASTRSESALYDVNLRFDYVTNSGEQLALHRFEQEDLAPWDLVPGEYFINSQVFSGKERSGYPGGSADLILRIQQSELRVLNDYLFLDGIVGETGPTQILRVANVGNIAAALQVKDVPEWLRLNNVASELAPLVFNDIQVSASACEEAGVLQGAFAIVEPNGDEREVRISYSCSDARKYDLAIERFYFNQGVPAADTASANLDQVPLLQGREGLARAFVLSNNDLLDINPQVRLFYRINGGQLQSIDLRGPSTVAERGIDEGNLRQTFNSHLEGDFFSDGLEFYVQVDPDNLIDESNEQNNRYPEQGFARVSVVEVNPIQVVILPYSYRGMPLEISEQRLQQLFDSAKNFLPLPDISIDLRSPAVTQAASLEALIAEVNDIRNAEGGSAYYMGLVSREASEGFGGLGVFQGRVSVSIDDADTIAHELGHNLSLKHVDCGGPENNTAFYPIFTGETGTWNYNISDRSMVSPFAFDFMSYCPSNGVSEYSYLTALFFLLGRDYEREIFESFLNPESALGMLRDTSVSAQGSLARASAPAVFKVPEALPQDILRVSGLLADNAVQLFKITRRVGALERGGKLSGYKFIALDQSENILAEEYIKVHQLGDSQKILFEVAIPFIQSFKAIKTAKVVKRGKVIYQQEVKPSFF